MKPDTEVTDTATGKRGGPLCPIRVEDQMSTPPIVVDANAGAFEIARVLEQRSISAVPVVERDRLVGLVSITDLLAAGSGSTARAGELMSAPAIVAHGREDLETVAWRMMAARVHRVVVTEHDKAVGILSSHDILEEVACRPFEAPIRTVMSTPVESIGIGEPIDGAVARLVSSNVHGLLVVDGLAPVGLFTQREALTALRLPPAFRARPVEEVMSHRLLFLDPQTKIRRAATYCAVMNARRIVVRDGQYTVGIVTSMDLVQALARQPS
jgi:CBS domain-containing protein